MKAGPGNLQDYYGLYLRLLAVPFVLSLIDVGVTLYYQPFGYWHGDRSQLVEFNPFVWVAMRIHPALIIPGFLGWYVLFSFLIFRTPSWIGLRCHVSLVAAHLIAISGWMLRHHDQGFILTLLLIVVSVPLAAMCFRPFRSQWNGSIPVRRT